MCDDGSGSGGGGCGSGCDGGGGGGGGGQLTCITCILIKEIIKHIP